MPANLNALIRYKTINSCLYGGKRRWSIKELIERCSEALGENRGRYTGVSERTIRDDIRVMRSDILGFNAPITQEGGLYFYSDPGYSILSLRITDVGLAEQIYGLLIKIRERVSHPELEIILLRLCSLLGKEYEPVAVRKAETAYKRNVVFKEEISIELFDKDVIEHSQTDTSYNSEPPTRGTASRGSRAAQLRRGIYELLWGDVLGALALGHGAKARGME